MKQKRSQQYQLAENGALQRQAHPKVDWLRLYLTEIQPRLSVEIIFGKLERFRMHGGKLRAACPLHGGHNLNFAIDLESLTWHCHSKCGEGGGPLDFLHRKRGGVGKPRGSAFVELIKELCVALGVSSASTRIASIEHAPDVERVWSSAVSVTSDREVARWLELERGIDPEMVTSCDLARVVRDQRNLPPWTGFEQDGRWHSWPSRGYRIIVPLYDSRGRLRSLRFREPRAGSKGRSASGVSGVGLVMADKVAREILASGRVPEFWIGSPFTVLIAYSGRSGRSFRFDLGMNSGASGHVIGA